MSTKWNRHAAIRANGRMLGGWWEDAVEVKPLDLLGLGGMGALGGISPIRNARARAHACAYENCLPTHPIPPKP